MENLGGKYLTFVLDKETYGISINQVKEIIGMTAITHIPEMPDYLKGVIKLRGKIIPVMDLRLKFGMEELSETGRNCIVIIELNMVNNNCLAGVIVDKVTEVINLQNSDIEKPGYDAQVEGDFLIGLGKLKDKMVLLIEFEKIFNQQELAAIKKGLPEDETD